MIEDNFGWDKKELNQLRLLPTPVYRYGNPDDEVVEMALEEYFEEAPLDVIPVRIEHPVSIAGAGMSSSRATV